MSEHSLSSACAYTNDFKDWCLNSKSPPDVMIFVNDRFSQCGEEKKKVLFEIFNKFCISLLSGEKSVDDTDEILKDLIQVI